MKLTKVEHPLYGDVYVLQEMISNGDVLAYSNQQELQSIRNKYMFAVETADYGVEILSPAFQFDTMLAYSYEKKRFVNYGNSIPVKLSPMTEIEYKTVCESLVDYLTEFLVNNKNIIPAHPMKIENKQGHLRQFLFNITKTSDNNNINSYLYYLKNEILAHPKLQCDSNQVLSDLRKLFNAVYSNRNKFRNITRDSHCEKLIFKFIGFFNMYLRNDFETYYNALADEYNFEKCRNMALFFDEHFDCSNSYFTIGGGQKRKSFSEIFWPKHEDLTALEELLA